MKNKPTPYNLKELQQFLEDYELTDTINKFKLESINTADQFGLKLSPTYTITVTLDCKSKDE